MSDSVRRHLSVPVSRQGVPYGKALGGDGERAGMKVPISGYARIEMDAPCCMSTRRTCVCPRVSRPRRPIPPPPLHANGWGMRVHGAEHRAVPSAVENTAAFDHTQNGDCWRGFEYNRPAPGYGESFSLLCITWCGRPGTTIRANLAMPPTSCSS